VCSPRQGFASPGRALEKTTAEAMLRSFMRDVLAVYEGKQDPSDTPLGVVQAYAWSYFVRVSNPEQYF